MGFETEWFVIFDKPLLVGLPPSFWFLFASAASSAVASRAAAFDAKREP
jgi:hypothetical protein